MRTFASFLLIFCWPKQHLLLGSAYKNELSLLILRTMNRKFKLLTKMPTFLFFGEKRQYYSMKNQSPLDTKYYGNSSESLPSTSRIVVCSQLKNSWCSSAPLVIGNARRMRPQRCSVRLSYRGGGGGTDVAPPESASTLPSTRQPAPVWTSPGFQRPLWRVDLS